MRVTLVSPRIAVQKGDFLGSGVPYWPIELATLAGLLRERGDSVSVLDLFGSDPARLADHEDYYLQGVSLDAHLTSQAVSEAEAFIIYALSYMSHQELLAIVCKLKAIRPDSRIAILENSQAVTAYSLQRLSADFFSAGADLLICGEPYFNWNDIAACLTGAPAPDNVITPREQRPPRRIFDKHASYPLPAWDLFHLEGYWSLPYSHGPKTGRFLPILTSRGCPYPCDFCVVPETNDRRWRGRCAAEVVDEIITLRDRFNVRDFQIEDLNPTVSHLRWEEICRLLIARQADIRFYLVSGTKAETVRVDQVGLLARAGCRYISISPESGSPELMRVIGKPFNYRHGVDLVRACREHGIRTQACFLVGHPAEVERDFVSSLNYLRALVRAGLDEVAVFIVASFAGSALHAANQIAVSDDRALTSFSPKGRLDYDTLVRRRRSMIRAFFLEKLRRGPELWLQALRAFLGQPQTKMENLPWRISYIFWLISKHRLLALIGRK